MSDSQKSAEAIFDTALQLPAAERAGYIRTACAGDGQLRQRVETLLGAHESAGAFMDSPAVDPGRETPILKPSEQPGDRIGRYKLLQQIGEGGCGVVYMADQEEPVRRKVALKVIKLGMDTRQVIARFEAERQALALMDHPNIAKVFDAGATETGRPYFVMELIQGVPITRYCDENNLSTVTRLGLFVQVCQAIQHAHQKGIIHRDIKPSNMLVTVNDGVVVPKVIDFGIAKATQGRLTNRTLFTASEQFLGTPAYMSPEQAVMTSLDVDTRSDIYGLGILLYELLTGQTPFDAKRLLQAGLDEIRRTIREQEPVRPSIRLSTMLEGELKTAARQRQAEGPKLIHLVRGDLDWIVMKALEKDRTRRYETANGLAMDVQRHLTNEPVLARPPSRLYQLQKLIQRNQITFIAGAAVACSLFIGLAASMSLLVREKQARRQLQTEAERSRQVTQFLKEMLNGVGPYAAMGRDTTILREILDKTAERIGHDLANQPSVQAELQNTIGNLYSTIGDYKKAELLLRQSYATRKRLFGQENPAVVESLSDLATFLDGHGSQAEAEPMFWEALASSKKNFGSQSPQVANASLNLGMAIGLGKPAEAEHLIREALAIDRKAWGENSTDLARPLKRLGLVLSYQGKNQEAELVGRQALELDLKAPGRAYHEIANSESDLANILASENKFVEAEAMARASLAVSRKIPGKDSVVLIYVADSLNMLSSILCDAGKLRESEAAASEAVEIERKVEPDHPPMLPWSLETLAKVHGRTGRWKDAMKDLTLLVELQPSSGYAQCALAVLLVEDRNLSEYRARCGKIPAALGANSKALDLYFAAQACLLIPTTGGNLETAAQLADREVKIGSRNHVGHVFELPKGLAEYRRGRFADSVTWMDKVIQAGKTNADANSDVIAYAVTAMAENQLQHFAQARAALARGSDISRTKMQQPGDADLGVNWPDWLVARIFLREAQALIDGSSAPVTEPSAAK